MMCAHVTVRYEGLNRSKSYCSSIPGVIHLLANNPCMSHTGLGAASTQMLVCGVVCTCICPETAPEQKVILCLCRQTITDVTVVIIILCGGEKSQ